ncbi:MAG TPA: hypothetical protein DCY40_04950 [Actinobacteria bacterium]|nr:hypothetical protein [Actinomycetota bacterium]
MDITLVLLGVVLITYGWYWAGITESRTTAYALGVGSLLLALTFAFTGGQGGDAIGGGLWALGAIFAFLAAANAWNESSQDRTYGMFALLFAVGAFFAFMAFDTAGDIAGQYSYSALLLVVTFIMHFISAALVPDNRGFKAFVGWFTLFAGAALLYFGFANALDAAIDPM